jgi:hypothetical protein
MEPMRTVGRVIVVALLATTACGSSEDTTTASRSPVPRVAPSTEPEDNFDEAPQPAAEPPGTGSNDKAAAKICEGLAEVDDAEDPAGALRDLARQAAQNGLQFRRLLTLLQRAYVKGDFEKARGYIDRLAAICEEVEERRNF